MISSIRVADRREAEKERNGFGAAVISITDTDAPPAKLHGSWNLVLRLTFDDIDPEWWKKIGAIVDQSKCFRGTHAKEIFEFVDLANTMPAVNRLVVHCEHGVSRSGAIGEFLAAKLGVPLTSKHELVPNLHMLALLEAEWLLLKSPMLRYFCDNER